MIDYCFNVKGFLTLWSDFFIDNPASGRVMEKCGFKDTGELFVDSATDIARRLGVSDKFIAITMLAGGTSFPELATCIVAAAKHKDQLALGNILGSNVFNILLILGCSSVITPLSFGGMSLVDVGILIASCVLLLLWAYSGRKCRIDRWEGAVMLLVFAAYYCYLFVKL